MNAKDEFIQHINNKEILCCEIIGTVNLHPVNLYLTTGWLKEEWVKFINDINVVYDDSGHGSQNLYGTIWYKDGTYLIINIMLNNGQPDEYDGRKWWEMHSCPTIPSRLNRIDKVREEKLSKIINEQRETK
jgi:hypothetical protein